MANTGQTLQLVEIHGETVAVRATGEQVDELEREEGLWTAEGTVRVLSFAAAKREARSNA